MWLTIPSPSSIHPHNTTDSPHEPRPISNFPISQSRREWSLIGLLFAIMLIKGALWSLAFPLWQGPDEDDHYAVIQFIGENGRLPDTTDTTLPDEIILSRTLADVGRLD